MTVAAISNAIDSILGKRFRLHGRGPEYFDCLGVVLALIREVEGVTLPDPFGEAGGNIFDFWRSWEEIGPAHARVFRPLDVLYRRDGQRRPHVSMVENERWVVTSEDPVGVVRVRFFEAHQKAETAFRLRRAEA